MKRIFYLVTLFPLMVFSQGKIILNGGTIHLQNGAHIVLQNNYPDAITILDSSSGIFINDAISRLRWHIGETSGNYFIPFRQSKNVVPLSFETSNAKGSGYFDLSTYHVPTWKNSEHLPPGISSVNNNGQDNSQHLIDRFWLIQTQNYSAKPTLNNLRFSYTDDEWNVSENTISESMLKAQRWNSKLDAWSDYELSGFSNPSNTQVLVSSVSASDLFEWWTLVDADYPLNEELDSKLTMKNESLLIPDSRSGINIYPNPIVNTLTIDIGSSGAKEIQIMDVTGRKVYQQLISAKIQKADLSSLPAGTYFLQLIKGYSKQTYKVVKE